MLTSSVLSILSSAAAAQDDVFFPSVRATDIVGVEIDGDAGAATALRRPTLRWRDEALELTAWPHAAYAIFAGFAADRDGWIEPVALLGGGCLGDGATVRVMVPDADRHLGPAAVLLQAFVLSADQAIVTSDILVLRRPIDGATKVHVLELDNQLPQSFPVAVTMVSTDGIPPHWTVQVAVEVPTSGYRLKNIATDRYEDHTHLVFVLQDPDPALQHMPVIETMFASADLDDADSDRIVVTVRRALPDADRDRQLGAVQPAPALGR